MNKRTVIFISFFLIIVVLVFLFYKSIAILDVKPNTNREAIKTILVNHILTTIDSESEVVGYNVTGDNQLEGVYGMHILKMKTSDNMRYEVYIENDLINYDKLNVEDIKNDYILNRIHYFMEEKIKEMYKDESIFVEFDGEEKVLYRSSLSYNYDQVLYIDDYIQKEKSTDMLISDFMNQHKDDLLKDYMSIELKLYNKTNHLVKDINQENIDEFYMLYKTITSKHNNEFKLDMSIFEHNDKTGESTFVPLEKGLSYEEMNELVKNFEKHAKRF